MKNCFKFEEIMQETYERNPETNGKGEESPVVPFRTYF
jgi:hypothetical protein